MLCLQVTKYVLVFSWLGKGRHGKHMQLLTPTTTTFLNSFYCLFFVSCCFKQSTIGWRARAALSVNESNICDFAYLYFTTSSSVERRLYVWRLWWYVAGDQKPATGNQMRRRRENAKTTLRNQQCLNASRTCNIPVSCVAALFSIRACHSNPSVASAGILFLSFGLPVLNRR